MWIALVDCVSLASLASLRHGAKRLTRQAKGVYISPTLTSGVDTYDN